MTIPELGVLLALGCCIFGAGWIWGFHGGYETGRDAGLVEQEERFADVDEARLNEAEAES